MNRRNFLALGGSVSVAALGGVGVWLASGDAASDSGTGGQPVQTVTDPPTAVATARPLAEVFHAHITAVYPDARVFITRQAEIVMEYQTDAESKGELTSELHRIASEYATVVTDGDYDPQTFTIVTSEVQAIAPRPTVRAYVNGDINREAYLKTIEVMPIDRTGADNRSS